MHFEISHTNPATPKNRGDNYPYGMRIPGESYVSGDYDNRLFNDKRLEEGHGLNWMDYGWRQYDPAIARWTMVDPADEFHTPYSYVGGDPVNWTDPDGRQAYKSNPMDMIYSEGEALWSSVFGPDTHQPSATPSGSVEISGLFLDFVFGTGTQHNTYNGDGIALAMADSRRVNETREFFYAKYADYDELPSDASVGNYMGSNVNRLLDRNITGHGNFGLRGLVLAGSDPVEQFVGSAEVIIYNTGDGTLTFVVRNNTSLSSLGYGILPSRDRGQEWHSRLFGTTTQDYIWVEPIRR